MVYEFQTLLNDLVEEGFITCADKYLIEEYVKRAKSYVDKRVLPPFFNKPLGVQLEITEKCNMKCIFCYNRSGEPTPRCTELKDSEWISLAHELVNLGIYECVISGGEPLLRKDLVIKVMSILGENDVRFILITNGFFFDQEFLSKIMDFDFAWIQVSIDAGTPELHDYVRGLRGSWYRAVKAAKMVHDAGIPLCIATTLVKANLKSLPETIDMACALGADRFITGEANLVGRAAIHTDSCSLGKSDIKFVNKVLEEKREEYRFCMEVVKAVDPGIHLNLAALLPPRVALIRPNGRVKVDCILPFVFGNIKRESLGEIWEKRASKAWHYREVREYIRKARTNYDLLRLKPIPYVDEDVFIGYED